MSADFSNISWPGWETVDLIGRGSFGAVYKIERKVFNDTEKAALKVISIPQNSSDIEEMYSDGYDNESITSTFQSHLESIVAEYSLMRKMNGCANIVNCDDVRYVQRDDGIGWDIFIKMELLAPLAKSLPAEISDEMVIKIAKDMCRALELCKKHGIVHRDIKPQNIFVSEHGDYKLGDFGIAKTVEKTTGGTKIGTYKYMAPEVYNNQPYGSAADIYSLGLVLYWLLNERRMPFLPLPPAKLRAGQDEDARHRRLSGEALPGPAHGSDELKRIVLKACAYDTQDRYSSAALMLDDLNRLTGEAIVAGAVASVDGDETEQQEDELTTGPVFARTPVQNAAPEEGEVDATVGPVFGSKVIAEERREPAELDKRKDEKKSFVKYALIALGVVAIIIILLLLKTCTGPVPSGTDSTAGSGEDTSSTTGDTTGESTGMQQVDWSGWQDSLPDYVTAEDYEIEEQEVWGCITVVDTTSSTTQKTMDGWEMYHETKANTPGAWSQWSPNKAEDKEGREFEQKQCYSFCNKETTTTATSSLSGWTLYNTTYTLGDYPDTYKTAYSKPEQIEGREIVAKTIWEYRDIQTTTSTSKSLDGWTRDEGKGIIQNWGASQTTTSKPQTGDGLRITATTQTGWGYHHFCNPYGNNSWGVDSVPVNGSTHHHYCTTSFALPASYIQDQGGQQSYGGTGSGAPGCTAIVGYSACNFYYWFRNPSADVYTYTYQTCTPEYHFYKWSTEWKVSETEITAIPGEREVRQKTVYYYRDREQVPVYHFWRYTGNWSAWDPTPQTKTDTRDIQQKLCYRYRDKLTETTYYFRKWSDWEDSEWTTNEIIESDTVKVQKKTQYRFKSKLP